MMKGQPKLPPVYEDNHFCIEQSMECLLPGYLIVFIKKPCQSLVTLEKEVSCQLILLLKQAQQAIHEIIKPEKIYLCSFGEVLPQLHYHLFPRTHSLTLDYQAQCNIPPSLPIDGLDIMKWAKQHFHSQYSIGQIQDYHGKLSHNLQENIR